MTTKAKTAKVKRAPTGGDTAGVSVLADGYVRSETMDTICGCIAQGLPLVKILALDGMPSYATVMRWLSEDVTLQENYVRAREASADYLADEIVHIADNEPDPQVARVRIDARKWVAAKMKPKKYGDKIETTHTGTITLEHLVAGIE